MDEKKIVVNIIGGLGNQMFQYCMYLVAKKYVDNVTVDISEFINYNLHNNFELEKVFDIELPKENDEVLKKLKKKKDILSKLKRKIFRKKLSHIREKNFNYSIFEDSKSYYLDGYWQGEAYLSTLRQELVSKLSFKGELSEVNLKLLEKVKRKELVSLHIRRGDYLEPKNVALFAICTEHYYLKAIKYFQEKYANCHFLIFSNDIDWCIDTLNIESPHDFIDWNSGKNSYEDLWLMSLCNHNVIANSSFSWWGAYLNNNIGKEVIAPKKWWNNEAKNHLVYLPDDYIRIDNY